MSNPEIPEDILRLLSRARAFSRQGQFEQACELHEIITRRMRDLVGERNLIYAQSLSNFGLVLLNAGEFGHAETLLRQSFEITNAAPDATLADRALAANNLGGFYQQLGHDAESLPLFTDALELERVENGEAGPGYAQILNNVALALSNLGRYEEAEPLTKRALEIRRLVLPPMHPDIGQSLNNLGILYDRMGRYSEADSPARESISIYREAFGHFHPNLARSLANLALLQQRMARGDEAAKLFEEALSIALRSVGEIHPVTRIVGNWGMLYHDVGLFSDAKRMFEAEVGIAGELEDASPEHLGMALNHLGLVQLRLEEYPEARESLERALYLLRSDSPESELLVASVLNNLSLVNLETGHHADAEASLREVCSIRSKILGEGHPDYEMAMYNLATCLIPQRRFGDAATLLERGAAIDDVLLEQVFSISSEEERLALTDVVRQRFERLLFVLSELFESDEAASLSAFDLVLRRKCIVLDAAAAQRHAIYAEKYPELQGEFANLSKFASEITRMVMDGPGRVTLATYERQVAELRRRADRIEADLSSRIPEMRTIIVRRKGSRRAIAASLPDYSALLEFVRINSVELKAGSGWNEDRWNRPRYFCFVILDRNAEAVKAIDLGDADVIDEIIARARTAIIEEGTQMGLPSDSTLRSARRAIFDPIEKLLDGRKQLIISPDGDVAILPFETLMTESDQPLVDEYSFRYVTNASDLLHADDEPRGEAHSVLVMVDPDYDLKSSEHGRRSKTNERRNERTRSLTDRGMFFVPIPGTRKEGELVGSLLKTAPITGSHALERVVKLARAPRILHLATHGFFLERKTEQRDVAGSVINQRHGTRIGTSRNLRDLSRLDNPLLRSGLALAGANTSRSRVPARS
jgi:tetratricopeptide (TPR) repeat protein